jgi:hypothetical protein
MPDAIIHIVGTIWLVLTVLGLFLLPVKIGKPASPYTASSYAGALLASFLTLILVGRALGWW